MKPRERIWQAGFHTVERADGGSSDLRIELIAGVLTVTEKGTLVCVVHQMEMNDPSLLGTLECPQPFCRSRGRVLVSVGSEH